MGNSITTFIKTIQPSFLKCIIAEMFLYFLRWLTALLVYLVLHVKRKKIIIIQVLHW